MAILIGVTVALLLAAALLLAWLLSREHRPHGGRVSAPPMVFLPPEGSPPPIVRPPYASSPHASHVVATDDGITRPQLIQERVALESVAAASSVAASSSASVPVESPTLAINRRRITRNRPPADSAAAMGTLRMLPGRLVPEDRQALRDDIRFIALDTTGEQRFTLGRGDGPLHEHIQIASPTVSRRHATMLYAGSVWSIANLSETNPVRVNGTELRETDIVSLSEGDLIEMGDLVLRFRS
ncbi:MAG: FHA domain-containing protein [Gemmatimonadaceae bacterium]